MDAVGRENLRGIAFMVAGVGTFALMDGGLKWLAPHYPPMQVAALRGLSSLPLVLAWVVATGGLGAVLRVRWRLHLLRGVLAIVMLACFAWALRHLPLGEAYAIFFVAPLLITALAGPLLGERVGATRWTAIGLGLAGVLVVLRPSAASVSLWPGLAMLFAATAYALSALTVRVLGRTDSTQSMVFWMVTMLSVGATALAAPTWIPIRSVDWPVLAGIAVTGAVGQWAITEAFRRGEAAVVAPLEYTALAWGLGLDWAFWSTAPNARTLLGALIVVAAGVYLIRNERRAQATAPPSPPDPAL
jgi:drug/metabolite transporter (DMT)-like permease